MSRHCQLTFACFILMAVGALGTPARADLSLAVDVGWEGHFRAGRWAPLFITLSDTTARPVLLELYTPHGNGFGMNTRLAVSVSPAPATYPVYLPLPQGARAGDVTIVVRDARTEGRLAQWPGFDQLDRSASLWGDGAADVLIGTSGRAPTMRGIASPTRDGNVQTVHVEPLRLPVNVAGYDSFNLLVLNQPDLNRLSGEQQQSIADWIRAGGNLLLWPSDDAVPQASPLVIALPCEIGEPVALETDRALLEQRGLPARFATMRGRQLQPRPGAQRVEPLGPGGPVAWRGRVGFGQVIVLPFDPSFFVFRDGPALRDFWAPLLAGIIDLRAPPDAQTNPYYYWNDPMRQRRALAFNNAAELLGDVPGVGRFGFTYVAVVMIALTLIVGPVDWFVLRYLGRQPWTWITTSGWIGLVTVGALFVGHLFKSGDLHFRTLRIIEQADGQTIATVDLAALYAPRTSVYAFDTPRESWWQPGADIGFRSGNALRTDIPFRQDALANRPLPILVNVWNLRFLQGQTVTTSPAVIAASLAWGKTEAGQNRVIGSITNRSSSRLRNVIVRVSNGAALLPQPIEPGATVTIDQPIDEDGSAFRIVEPMYARPPPPGTVTAGPDGRVRIMSLSHWRWCDLDPDRSRIIDQLLDQRADVACIYAEVVDPQAAVKLGDPTAIERHWQVVRALVPISTGSTP